MSAPRIGELFAGYGGLGMGVKAVLGGDVAWVSEIDKGAKKVLEYRFPDIPNHGDTQALRERRLAASCGRSARPAGPSGDRGMTRRMPLTKGASTLVDDADYAFLSRWRWKLHPQGYACRSTWVDGRAVTLMMHRVIANTPAHLQTDHINRDRLDNRRANLRNVSGSANTMNQGLNPRNTSGHRGVTWDKSRGKWQAKTKHLGRWVFLGRFDTAEAAGDARRLYDQSERGAA